VYIHSLIPLKRIGNDRELCSSFLLLSFELEDFFQAPTSTWTQPPPSPPPLDVRPTPCCDSLQRDTDAPRVSLPKVIIFFQAATAFSSILLIVFLYETPFSLPVRPLGIRQTIETNVRRCDGWPCSPRPPWVPLPKTSRWLSPLRMLDKSLASPIRNRRAFYPWRHFPLTL